jgi:hypothetical protein
MRVRCCIAGSSGKSVAASGTGAVLLTATRPGAAGCMLLLSQLRPELLKTCSWSCCRHRNEHIAAAHLQLCHVEVGVQVLAEQLLHLVEVGGVEARRQERVAAELRQSTAQSTSRGATSDYIPCSACICTHAQTPTLYGCCYIGFTTEQSQPLCSTAASTQQQAVMVHMWPNCPATAPCILIGPCPQQPHAHSCYWFTWHAPCLIQRRGRKVHQHSSGSHHRAQHRRTPALP